MKLQRTLLWLSVLTIGAVTWGGCLGVQRDNVPAPGVDPFDPRGGDAPMAFSWRIDGRDPATDPTACSDADVQFLRMTILDGAGGPRTFPSLQWDCNLGRYRSASPELRAGSYRVYFEAVAADGTRRSVAPGRRNAEGNVEPAPEAAVVVAGRLYDFDEGNTVDPSLPGNPTNFATTTGALEVAVTYTRGQGLPVDCATAGVDRIRWQLLAPNGVAVEDHTMAEECARYATIRWPRVFLDRYSLAVTAFQANGDRIGTGRCTGLLVRRGTEPTRFACEVALPPR